MSINCESFIETLEALQLLPKPVIEEVRSRWPRTDPAVDAARWLVKQRHLTQFQVDRIFEGRCDRLKLGNYIITASLGRGGMGEVYVGRHCRMNREVAIKILPDSAASDQSAITRFKREVEVAARLTHPNIVAAYDADESAGTHFLVLEYIKGDSLFDHVNRKGPLPAETAVRFIVKAALGLGYAHQQGIVHRDVKPSNIMLTKAGEIKILDMGLARLDYDAKGDPETATRDYLTHTGTVLGTVDYLAPEQARSIKDTDHRADIYSLGCTLYFLMTGRAPYDGETVMQRVMAHVKAPIPSLAARCPDCPEALDRVFRRMLAKRPEDRLQTMGEVNAALRVVMPISDEFAFDATGSDAEGAHRFADAATLNRSSDDTSINSSRSLKTRVRLTRRPLVIGGTAVTALSLIAVMVVVRPWQPRGHKPPPDRAAVDGDLAPGLTTAPPAETAGAASNAVDNDRDPERRAAEHFLGLGAQLTIGINGTEQQTLTVAQLPSEPFDVLDVRCPNSKDLVDEDLALLGRLRRLRILGLYANPQITDEGLRHLEKVTTLEQCSLSNTQIGDRGIFFLTKNKSMTNLEISGTRVTDSVVDSLVQFPKLRVIDVGSADFTGGRLKDLEQSASLSEVCLREPYISLDLVQGINQLSNVRHVRVYQVRDQSLPALASLRVGRLILHNGLDVAPKSLARLAGISDLATLELVDFPLTLDHKDALATLDQLYELNLVNTGLSHADAAVIRQGLPHTLFRFESAELDRANRRAAEWVLEMGGKVQVRLPTGKVESPLSLGRIPEGPFSVIRIELANVAGIKDADLIRFSQLTALDYLDLDRTGVSDEGLEHLRNLWALRDFRVGVCPVTDDGLRRLAGLRQLRSLGIWTTRITSAGLAHLQGMRRMKHLNAGGCAIDDTGLRALRGLDSLESLFVNNGIFSADSIGLLLEFPRLKTLHLMSWAPGFPADQLGRLSALPLEGFYLAGSTVSPEQLKALGQFSRLTFFGFQTASDAHLSIIAGLTTVKTLALYGPDCSVDGLRSIGQMANLTGLQISGPTVGDRLVPALGSLQQILNLTISDSRISSIGRARLEELLPNCTLAVGVSPFVDSPEYQAARWVIERGGRVTVRKGNRVETPTTENELPLEGFSIESVSLADLDVVDSELSVLSSLQHLPELDLSNCVKITDDGLRHLKTVALTKLVLNRTNVTGPGLDHLDASGRLTILALWQLPLADNAMEHVVRFKELNSLSLVSSREAPQESSLDGIAGLKSLTYLGLSGLSVTSANIEQMAALPALGSLAIAHRLDPESAKLLGRLSTVSQLLVTHCATSAEGIESLAAMPALRALRFEKVAFDDRATVAIKTLGNLRTLELFDTGIDGPAVADLQRALPDCEIVRDSPAFDLANREAAKWVIEIGGEVTVRGRPGVWIRALDDLPVGSIRVSAIRLAGIAEVQDADLERFQDVTRLQSLVLDRTSVTGAGLRFLEGHVEMQGTLRHEDHQRRAAPSGLTGSSEFPGNRWKQH